MAELLPQFCQLLATSFASAQSTNLLNTIPLGPDHPYWTPLQQSLTYTRPESVSAQSILPYLEPIPSNTRDGFSAFVLAILDNVHPIHTVQRALQGQSEGERAYGEFSRLLAVYTETNRLYAMSANGPYLHAFLNGLVLDLAKRLVKLSRKLHYAISIATRSGIYSFRISSYFQAAALSTAPSRDPTSSRSIKDITRQTIERSFQVSSSPVASGEWDGEVGKQHFAGDIMWALGNILWRIYAERKLHTQAVELRRSVQSLTPAEDKRLAVRGSKVRQADVCESWYWRGRLGVVLLDMRGAKYSLDRAWRMCPEVGWQQRRAILIRLIPINLLLGILPRPGILEEYNLLQYSTLLNKYRTGEVAGWRKELERGREWLRRRNVWLILYERGEILVWRNLFREALRIYYILYPAAPPNRCPTWIFISAATQAFANTGEVEDGDIGLEDIICVISTLIDQGLILGNLSYSQQTLVMKPSADGMGGFPKLSMVVPRTVISVA